MFGEAQRVMNFIKIKSLGNIICFGRRAEFCVRVCARVCVPAVKGVLTLGDLIEETAKPVSRRGLCCFQKVAGAASGHVGSLGAVKAA